MSEKWQLVLLIYLCAVSLIAFILFGTDKHRAVNHQWRIPESTLILTAWAGGGIGALLGMMVFHHKTRKWKFRILVPLAVVLWAGVIYWLLF